MIGDIFFGILYQPLYNLLIVLYNLAPWGGLGLSIILLTVFIKVLTLPLSFKSMKSQKEMQEIQPKIAAIKVEFKDDQEKLAKELMGVYKKHNVNPFAACLPTILQLVVFIALSKVLYDGINTVNAGALYPFVQNPEVMGHTFLFMDLAAVSIPLAILAAAMQYFQARQMVQSRPPAVARENAASLDEDMTASMNRMTLIALPIIMLVMGVTTLPGGATLYIFVSSLLTYLMYAVFITPKMKNASESAESPKIIDVEKS
jgi:YidC/Oxa1 family membrane protein insertase